MPAPTLIIGYGNIDRQDDGAAWHILVQVAAGLGRPLPDPDGGFPEKQDDPELMYVLQLTPDLVERISQATRVCFIDAHTGAIPEDMALRKIGPQFQKSPFTHHLTPKSLLSLAETLYHAAVEAVLVSVRGYEFGFGRELSQRTETLAKQAARKIQNWLLAG